ncbi:VOC family protein [Corallococcus sicarius]|uniref:VOC family protein n=1 Tax=Corallococcus sicarius TaxID=2316726 RepID=A0A3A8M2S9_9BACT|nr:VOC family protein [Corallococcus sicarius]
MATLRFAVPDVAAQRAFWDAMASWLGWTPARTQDGTAAYTGAGLGLVFTPGAPGASASAPVTVTLEAPSPAAVVRLKDLLQAHHPRSIVSGSEEGLKFQDPAGLMWEYARPPV